MIGYPYKQNPVKLTQTEKKAAERARDQKRPADNKPIRMPEQFSIIWK